MTEEEAKKKRCPFNSNLYSYCVAFDCMIWRTTDNEYKPQHPGDPKAKSEPAGYCGIGGKP